ncbi:hypothetical protein SUNI508_04164 [Seiridium unicorne]|uniref:Uncharacterized protein n=1 Tax=Seiridium unicorne TaxID=138068 RepID=A0ABR2V9W1_9PEZI
MTADGHALPGGSHPCMKVDEIGCFYRVLVPRSAGGPPSRQTLTTEAPKLRAKRASFATAEQDDGSDRAEYSLHADS